MTTDVVTFRLPLVVASITNRREHWSARHRRARAERDCARLLTPPQCRKWLEAPGVTPVTIHVSMYRVSERRLDDDNLVGSMKSVRDGVADALRLRNDADPRVTWIYGQRAPDQKCGEKSACVTVTIVRYSR